MIEAVFGDYHQNARLSWDTGLTVTGPDYHHYFAKMLVAEDIRAAKPPLFVIGKKRIFAPVSWVSLANLWHSHAIPAAWATAVITALNLLSILTVIVDLSQGSAE